MCGKALAMMLTLRNAISLTTGEKSKQSLILEQEATSKHSFLK